MTDSEIEMLSTLAIWFIGGWFVGWYGFDLLDNYLRRG